MRMFVARLDRIDGEYVVTIPHEVVVQNDLREGQTLSILVEPFSSYASVEAPATQDAEPTWKLNEKAADYRLDR
jgi:hypothetical protein